MPSDKIQSQVKRLVHDALHRMMQGDERADIIIGNIFRVNKVTDEIVRGETVRVFYGIIRFWRPITSAVRVGEILFPADSERLMEAFYTWRKLYNGKNTDRNQTLANKMEKYLRVRKIRESVTDWIDEQGVKELGEENWEKTLHYLNQEAPVFIRCNSQKISRRELMSKLEKEGIDAFEVDDLPEALVLNQYRNVFSTTAFRDGWFEVQDRSSQETGLFCGIKPGMVVIDACAGSGGKTLQFASIMKNSGKIFAMDVSGSKLRNLRERCTRAGVDLVEVTEIISAETLQPFREKGDVVLLDVPCTGSGVMRRNPDARWRMDEDELNRLLKIQKEILSSYSEMVRPGGTLVYSTCSIFPSEGEMQAKWFTETFGAEWEFVEEKRTGIDRNLGDGFYMAKWIRKAK